MPTKLGQNFLTDEGIVKKIIAAADLQPADLVLEIGPGRGILTAALSQKVGSLIAVELDEELAEALHKKLSGAKNVEIINADILKINLAEFLKNDRYKVIANIPYYITSKIIRLFLENELPPQEMILMVQKEVAERIAAQPGQMSILAASVQYYAEAEILFSVDKNSFAPVPEVDSAVIRITYAQKNPPDKADAKKFFSLVKAGFSAKRKTLVNNLANSLHLDKQLVEEKIKKIGLLPTTRAQELSVEDWKGLTKLF